MNGNWVIFPEDKGLLVITVAGGFAQTMLHVIEC
jgi:hypothetical protein